MARTATRYALRPSAALGSPCDSASCSTLLHARVSSLATLRHKGLCGCWAVSQVAAQGLAIAASLSFSSASSCFGCCAVVADTFVCHHTEDRGASP